MKQIKSIKSLTLLIISFMSVFMALNAEPQDNNSSHKGECSVIRINGRCGLKDSSGNIMVPPIYSYIHREYFDNQLSSFSSSIRNATESYYKQFSNYTCRIFKVENYDPTYKYGLFNLAGEELLPVKYDDIYGFRNSYAVIELDGKCGFIQVITNEDGSVAKIKEIIAPKYDAAALFSEGLAPVRIGNKCGYINVDGEIKIPFKYEAACEFSDGLAAVKMDDKWGYIDRNGKLIIPCKYKVRKIDDDTYQHNLVDFLDSDKHYDFSQIGYFHDGLALVRDNNDLNYGYMNKNGVIEIPFKYQCASPFNNGKAYVKMDADDDTWITIDVNGDILSFSSQTNANAILKELEIRTSRHRVSTSTPSKAIDASAEGAEAAGDEHIEGVPAQ